MKTYLVGGAVRDQLMGRQVSDQDWVVVGSTAEAMAGAGFYRVGADFPVFHHPVTHEEYALARTERKVGPGYQGFEVHASPEVTLEQDLARRDLTINAMALGEGGELVDPYGGQADLKAKVLRHVSPAFAEDPVRVLRLARFAARYQDFRVAEETIALCRSLVDSGELDHLVPERVWSEVARGLLEAKPSKMFEVLRQCDALRIVLPELDRLWGVPQPVAHHPEIDTGVHVMMALDEAAAGGAPLEVRYAVMLHDLGKGETPAHQLPGHPEHEALGLPLIRQVNARLKVPSSLGQLAEVVCMEHTRVHRAKELRATSLVQLLGRIDIFRRPERLEWLLQACTCDARGRLGLSDRPYPQAERVRQAAVAVRGVNAGEIARAAPDRSQIATRLYNARVYAVKAALF